MKFFTHIYLQTCLLMDTHPHNQVLPINIQIQTNFIIWLYDYIYAKNFLKDQPEVLLVPVFILIHTRYKSCYGAHFINGSPHLWVPPQLQHKSQILKCQNLLFQIFTMNLMGLMHYYFLLFCFILFFFPAQEIVV